MYIDKALLEEFIKLMYETASCATAAELVFNFEQTVKEGLE